MTASSAPTVKTTSGRVEGVVRGDVCAFLGIPYAAPPVGARRFHAPEPPPAWDGVRRCGSPGPACPQIQAGNPRYAVHDVQDEDCLFLNVWTPSLHEPSRPVMLFLHGGGYLAGSGATPVYDAARLAAAGVVAITCNYRLGAFGFLYLEELFDDVGGSANLGIQDHVRALEWIRDNVAQFGGDPARVTVFGSSAGGLSACALLATPRARGLFHRAIPISCAAGVVQTPDTATALARAVLESCGVAPGDTAALMDLSVQQLVGDRERIIALATAHGLAFAPVIDGEIIRRSPLAAVGDGEAAGIDLMIGCTAEEAGARRTDVRSALDALALRVVPLGRHDPARGFDFAQLFGPDGPGDAEIVEVYSSSLRASGRPAERVDDFVAAFSDVGMLKPTTQFALAHSAHHPRTYVFRFAWPSPGWDGALGAFHGVMTPYLFGNVDDPAWSETLGDHPPAQLVADVQSALVRFASNGDPGGGELPPWPAYDPEARATMVFDDPSALVMDPERDRRLLYERAPFTFTR